MSIEILFENPWLSLKQIVAPEMGINGYVFSHEARCKGFIIAVLPYRYTQDGPSGLEFLVKKECVPCWELERVLCALTGGWEGGEPLDDAVRELHEESGYNVSPEGFFSLGTSYASKSADTGFILFSVDLTGVPQEAHTGDGSQLESEAESLWVTERELLDIEDPQVHVMLNRLNHHLRTTTA